MTYADLQAALAVFGLGEQAQTTLEEIKVRHRNLVKQHHPDAGGKEPEAIRQVNAAYRVIMSYIESYRYNFSEQEFCRQNPEERL